MKRYNRVSGDMVENPCGAWVKYEDIKTDSVKVEWFDITKSRPPVKTCDNCRYSPFNSRDCNEKTDGCWQGRYSKAGPGWTPKGKKMSLKTNKRRKNEIQRR